MGVPFTRMGRRRGDRHKSKQLALRMPEIFRKQLELLCDRQVSTLTGEILVAIRKHLESHNLWPPSAK